MRTRTCVAFAPDGALATGTVKTDEVEIKLKVSDAPVVTTHTSVPNSRSCEETFSNDGKWLATVVSGSELTVVIHDSKTGSIHKQFSSEWRQVAHQPIEWSYESSFLGGFLPDDSLIVWRYVPRAVADPVDASHIDLHLQRWSIEGEMLSELDLGDLGFGVGGRHPIFANGLGLVWVPGRCASPCYKKIKISGAQEAGFLNLPADVATGPAFLPDNNGLLSILGQRSIQKVALLDPTGRLQKQVTLPYFPNLLRPVVPDWFYVDGKEISRDGEIAAVARTRVAWVLVDTDRDWGSEIVLLKMQPLAVATVLKTGKGGIGTIAVDHRNGMVRLVGFWKERWHDMKYDEQHPGKWTEANN
ncbi:MAG: hypothetical protein LAO76_09930 [Acidobacteriia bacterium]|nr:hypothetical protein [Terriglobia bacterium]